MAQPPMPSAMAAPPPGAAAGGLMPPDPSAGGDPTMGADPSAGGDDSGGDSSDEVVATVCLDGQGGFIIYAGDEPDAGGGDTAMSTDDTDAMGAAGDAPAGGASGGGMGSSGSSTPGQPAASTGAGLKILMDLMNAALSSAGAPGSADDQLSAGFSASKSPTPATGPQKY